MASHMGAPSGAWARGGFPNLPSRLTAGSPFGLSSTANQPVASTSGSSAFSTTSAFGSTRGGQRGRASSRGSRGGGRGGGGNALSRAEALVEEDPEAGEDSALDSDGLVGGADEDDDGKAHARSQRFNKKFEGNQFEKLHVLREQERKQAIANGEIDDPDNPNAPKRVGSLKGTCVEMCPRYEREEREHKFNVDRLELLAGTTNRIDHSRAVKMFHRPAAGNEQALPSDVRTPETLRRTLDYLFVTLLGDDPDLKATHSFIRDRTRSIRQDFSVQSDKSDISIACHERMARYHIHALHVLCANEGFSVQQEMEQMKKVFQSLDQFYTDRRTSRLASSTTPSSPHEAEFCGYLLLAHLWDTDILRKTESLPPYLFYTPEVQLALSLAYLAQRTNDPHAGRSKPTSELSQNFFTRFFKTVQRGSTPYLVACLVESHFGDIRKAGLLGLKKSFVKRYSTVAVEDLVGMLGCDDARDVAEVCEEFGLQVTREDGIPVSVEVSRESVIVDPRPNYHQRHSRRVVDSKRSGWTNAEIINGLAVRRRASSPVQTKTPVARPSISTSRTASKSSLSAMATPFQARPSMQGFAPTSSQPPSAFNSFPPSTFTNPFGQSARPESHHSLPRVPPASLPHASRPSNPFASSAASAPTEGVQSSTRPTFSSGLSSSAVPFVPRSVPASTSALPSSASPARVSPPTKPKARRTIHPSTVLELTADALTETIHATVARVSTDALETQRRLVEQRAALASALSGFIEEASASFAEDALDQAVLTRTRRMAGEALADEHARRSSGRTVLRTWRDAAIRRERHRVQEAKRRRQENEMGLSMRRVTLDDDEWSEGQEDQDKLMADRSNSLRDYQFTDAAIAKEAKDRAAFHRPSTFLDLLGHHLGSLTQNGMSEDEPLAWDVLLSTASAATSPILRKKLGLLGGSTSVSREAVGVDLRVGDEEEMLDSEEIGLVIFEADPSPNWSPEDDASRLRDVLDVVSPDNQLDTLVLIVSWRSPEFDEELVERLNLEYLSIPRENIGIAHLGVVVVDNRFDEAFADSVTGLIREIRRVEVRTKSAQAFIQPLEPIWRDLLDDGMEVLSLEPLDWEAACSTVDELIDVLNDFSTGVLEDLHTPKLASQVQLPPFAPAHKVVDDRSACVALQDYLDLSRFDGDNSIDLLKCDLRDARLSGSPPPFRAILETLFASILFQLHQLPPVRLTSIESDPTEWFSETTRRLSEGFNVAVVRHRKARAAAKREADAVAAIALRESESRSNMQVDPPSTPVRHQPGRKRPRTSEEASARTGGAEKGVAVAAMDGGASESPFQRLKRVMALSATS